VTRRVLVVSVAMAIADLLEKINILGKIKLLKSPEYSGGHSV
jgi:hypothetical protein